MARGVDHIRLVRRERHGSEKFSLRGRVDPVPKTIGECLLADDLNPTGATIVGPLHWSFKDRVQDRLGVIRMDGNSGGVAGRMDKFPGRAGVDALVERHVVGVNPGIDHIRVSGRDLNRGELSGQQVRNRLPTEFCTPVTFVDRTAALIRRFVTWCRGFDGNQFSVNKSSCRIDRGGIGCRLTRGGRLTCSSHILIRCST